MREGGRERGRREQEEGRMSEVFFKSTDQGAASQPSSPE
jgi:hypothetical protein